jgi:hypothetical protein
MVSVGLANIDVPSVLGGGGAEGPGLVGEGLSVSKERIGSVEG